MRNSCIFFWKTSVRLKYVAYKKIDYVILLTQNMERHLTAPNREFHSKLDHHIYNAIFPGYGATTKNICYIDIDSGR